MSIKSRQEVMRTVAQYVPYTHKFLSGNHTCGRRARQRRQGYFYMTCLS